MRTAKGALLAALAALVTAAAHGQPLGPGEGQANRAPSVKLTAFTSTVTLSAGCTEAEPPVDPVCRATSTTIQLSVVADDPDGDALRHSYSTTGGTFTGVGSQVTLDLSGLAPGVYEVTVKVDDGRGGTASDTAKIGVSRCSCPLPLPPPPQCPTVTVGCPSEDVRPGSPVTFTANVSGGDPNVTPTFSWTVPAATVSSGQGTSSITVDTTGTVRPNLTATVDVGGYDRSCVTSASCTAVTLGCVPMRKIDEYGDLSLRDEKLRLDNFAVDLRNDPTALGYLVCYGGRRSPAGETQRRCERAMKYASTRYFHDARRLVMVDGGHREELTVELWVMPSGSGPPPLNPTVDPSEVRPPARTRGARRRRGRR